MLRRCWISSELARVVQTQRRIWAHFWRYESWASLIYCRVYLSPTQRIYQISHLVAMSYNTTISHVNKIVESRRYCRSLFDGTDSSSEFVMNSFCIMKNSILTWSGGAWGWDCGRSPLPVAQFSSIVDVCCLFDDEPDCSYVRDEIELFCQ